MNEVKLEKTSGIILITTLFFIQLLAVLSWCLLENAVILLKIMRHNEQKVDRLIVVRPLLLYLQMLVQQHAPDCLVTLDQKQALMHAMPADWQSSTTCAGIFQQFHYYYIAELIGESVCAQSEFVIAKVDYWRLTVLIEFHHQYTRWQGLVMRHTPSQMLKPGIIDHCQLGAQSWIPLKQLNEGTTLCQN